MNKLVDAPLSAEAEHAGVGRETPHESAHLHVAGSATYTDDIPEVAGTLHCALGLSPVARGTLLAIELDAVRSMPGVVDVLTHAEIPHNHWGPIVQDDPVLAEGEVRYLGQPVYAVIATSRDAARRAAALAKQVVRTSPLPPVFSAREAHAQADYVVDPMHLVRHTRHASMEEAFAASKHRIKRSLDVGGQEQFYLEGQVCYAVPRDDRGVLVYSATQHPTETQTTVARALNWGLHQVQVLCRRIGGGFGGKETMGAPLAALAAVAAVRLNRPVKLRLDRDDDFLITGRRHGFSYDYEVGYDDDGRITAAEVTMISNAGHSADMTGPVMVRAVCNYDGAYWLPEVGIHAYSARTNLQSNTAFRGFGGPQGAIAIEVAIDEIARHLGKDALDVRRANYYGRDDQRDVAPYGQQVADNILHEITDQLVATSEYGARRAAIDAFNATSPVLKKGLALTPLKFGISFNAVLFNQAGAQVHVYMDGTVIVNHGGTEMGQGLNTKCAMIVAHEFGIDLARVRCTPTDTEKVPNTSPTAASTGADLNGKAAQDAARQVRDRLAALAVRLHGGHIADVAFANNEVRVNGQTISFADLAMAGWVHRVQLWSDGFYATPGLSWDGKTMTGHPFYYYAYGASVSEVTVDTLTGEWRLTRADLLADAGRSLNPAIDIGQVEGAFIQGMGWMTMEELVWHPTTGLLMTHAPSTYKIPTANDAPPIFNTMLFDGDCFENSVHRSKAVGEPPLLLSFSVLFALRDAISAAGGHRTDPPLSVPATSEAILRAVQAVRMPR